MAWVPTTRYRSAYDSKSHISEKVVSNPYTKRDVVIRKSTVRPWALRDDNKLEVNPYKFNNVERKKFRAAPIRGTRLIQKPAELRSKTMSGFKKAFFRWAHSKKKVNEWGREVSSTPYNKRGRLDRVLPKDVSHWLHKGDLSLEEIARFQVWMEREGISKNMQDMLFYAHYRAPHRYADGTLREDHEIFEFEDLRDKLMSQKTLHEGWENRVITPYNHEFKYPASKYWKGVAVEPYEKRSYGQRKTTTRLASGKSKRNFDPNYYYD